MSISPPNFEGQTYGSYTVGPQIAAHDRIQWHLGTALQSEQSYWLGFPSDDAVPCPEGFTKLNESGLDPEMWVRLVPPGCAISETLMAGPLSAPMLGRVLAQCASDTLPTSIDDIWWKEDEGRVTYIGVTPYSRRNTPSAPALGELIWYMATGHKYENDTHMLIDLLPQPTSNEFIDGLSALINQNTTQDIKALKTRLKALAKSISQPPDRVMTRQTTQELWDTNHNVHVSRAAGQPAFFIIGGLVTAAVVYLLAGLGFFPNEDIQPEAPTTQDSRPTQPK